MSDLNNLVWTDITSDFSPTEYANTFADDDVCEQLDELDSPEEQLLCLYENGYLSKRGGRIQYLLPEDAIDEASIYEKPKKEEYKGGRGAGTSGYAPGSKSAERVKSEKRAEVEGAFGKRVKTTYASAREGGMGKMGSAYSTAKRTWTHGGLKGKAAVGGAGLAGAAGLVGLGLGARALYKKMKKRKAAKAAKKESWDDLDMEFLLDEAGLLGFEFESIDELDETLELGAYIDDILTDAEESGLTEDYSEEDIVEAALEEKDSFRTMIGQQYAKGETRSMAKSARNLAQKQAQGGPLQRDAVIRAAHDLGGGAKAKAKVAGVGRATRATYHAGKTAFKGMSTGKKIGVGVGLAGAVGLGLGARALYKGMKKRRAAKKAIQASLNQKDLDRIIADSQELGFDFESYDELLEALQVGSALDELFCDYVEDDDLAENLGADDEYEVMECIISELDEDELDAVTSLPWDGEILERETPEAPEYVNESFTGYRSSAQGSVYESGPIPIGTGNRLYERINNTLLTTTFGQDMVNRVNG